MRTYPNCDNSLMDMDKEKPNLAFILTKCVAEI